MKINQIYAHSNNSYIVLVMIKYGYLIVNKYRILTFYIYGNKFSTTKIKLIFTKDSIRTVQ
jgi:hypothetical protein